MNKPDLKRRRFFASLASLGLAAAVPEAKAAPTEKTKDSGAIAHALDFATLRDETTRQATTFNLEKKGKVIAVPRGKRQTIAEVEGQGYIAQFWMTFPGWFWQHWNTGEPVNQSILKNLILRVYWDGAKEPAIAAPVGDFFGAGLCQVVSFSSRYFGTSSGGFFCKWPMPFRKGFRIEAENLDPAIDTAIFSNILYQLTPGLANDIGYFHAQFNTAKNPGPDPVPIAQ